MNRCLLLVLAGAFATCIVPGGALQAAGKSRFVEGKHYVRLDPSLDIRGTGGKVQVLEMFLYTCPHCFELDPKLKDWARGHKNVELKRMPAILGPTWGEVAKLYYAAEALGVLDRLHMEFYRAIHEKGVHFDDDSQLRQFVLSHGIDEADFQRAYWSRAVLDKMNTARLLSVKYHLRGVPVVIVNGKYKTAPFMARSQEEMLAVLDYLVAKESSRL